MAAPSCALGTPIEGTGTPLDGHNQPDNMPLFEVEDAAMAALQNWVTNGVQPAHGTSDLDVSRGSSALTTLSTRTVRRR